MATKTKTPPASPGRRAAVMPPPGLSQTPPWTTEERLQRIEAMGQRIQACVQFMCQIGGLGGTSGEAKDRAVAAFHERLSVLESELSRIREDLELG